MLVAYYEIEKVYNDDYDIWEGKWPFRIAEKVPENCVTTVGWNFLEYFCSLPNQRWYHTEKRRKGRVFCDPMRALEKEWCKPNFTVMHSHTYIAADPSIMDILNYPDIEKAAQYLKERGINIMEGLK